MIHLQDIVEAAADTYGFPVAEVYGRRRTAMLAEARQVAMWVARAVTDYSVVEIANHFDRCHTTVSANLRRIDSRLDAGAPRLAQRIREVSAPFMDEVDPAPRLVTMALKAG